MARKLELVKVTVSAACTIREDNGDISGETVGQAVVFANKWPEYMANGFADDFAKWTKEASEAQDDAKPNRATRRAATKRKPKAKPKR